VTIVCVDFLESVRAGTSKMECIASPKKNRSGQRLDAVAHLANQRGRDWDPMPRAVRFILLKIFQHTGELPARQETFPQVAV
jgi:hypothetical protein